MPTDLTELAERVEKAERGSLANWCAKCGFVALQNPDGHLVMFRGNDAGCGEETIFGTPAECIAALRAQGAQGEGDG